MRGWMQAPACTKAMHMHCAGLDDVPQGDWFCPQHARMAKARKASAKARGGSGAPANTSTTPTPPPPSFNNGAPVTKGARSKKGANGGRWVLVWIVFAAGDCSHASSLFWVPA